MKTLFYLFTLFFAGLVGFGQNNISAYEYWYDTDFSGKISTSVTPVAQLDLNILTPTTGLNVGIHTLNFRVVDQEGQYSSVLSKFFYKTPTTSALSSNKINAYEYWFDDNYSNAIVENTSQQEQIEIEELLTGNLTVGIHTFNIRFRDSQGLWSSVVSDYFYKIPQTIASTSANIVTYEYWYDDEYASAQTNTTVNGAQVMLNEMKETTALAHGIHTFHIRFKDNEGLWSSVLSEYFYKVPQTIASTSAELVEYEYWYDDEYTTAQTNTTVNGAQVMLNEMKETTDLAQGIHTFHIRFKDSQGLWSSVLSNYFYKVPETMSSTSAELVAYEYWFDDNYASAQYETAANSNQVILNEMLETTLLTNGAHTFHIRFKDNQGTWSSILSHYFYKTNQQALENNFIVAYRYWLDDDFEDAVYKNMDPPAEQLELIEALDFTMIPKDEYAIHFQFKDSTGLWSSIVTDSIEKKPLPIPIFDVDSTVFCEEGLVTFINNSIDGDEYLWDFGDGNTSTDAAPIHTYAAPGNYNVSLTAYDLSTPIDSTVVETELIVVFERPDVSIELIGNDSICDQEEVELVVETDGLYEWSTGAETASITVDEEGFYWVKVSNSELPVCYSQSQVVRITSMPAPIAGFEYSNDSLEVTFTNLSENGDNHQWFFGDGNESDEKDPVHSYFESEDYDVLLVTSNFCGSDSASLTVELAFLSVNQISDKKIELNLFPNPTDRGATIRMSEVQENINVKIFNSLGALIEDQHHQFTDTIELNLDVQSGTYIIQIISNDFEGVLRLVKQ